MRNNKPDGFFGNFVGGLADITDYTGKGIIAGSAVCTAIYVAQAASKVYRICKGSAKSKK